MAMLQSSTRAIIRDRGYAKKIFSNFETMSDEDFTNLYFQILHNQKEHPFIFQKKYILNTFLPSNSKGLVQAIEKTWQGFPLQNRD